jgi:hypothetical protein
MIESTRKLTAIKYAATLVGALAVVALALATAHALPVNNNEGGGCHYTDKDGYDIPIDEGQDVFVDGKIVSLSRWNDRRHHCASERWREHKAD